MTGWMKWMKRLAGRAGTALLVVILAVAMTAAASAASYMQPYLDKVVEWGVMRGDLEGNLNEDNYITRAEFSTMVNRAFGYDKTGPTPFRDVPENSWYAEDVGIAYNVGYIAGTSATTFSPNDNVTREQAALILARILMLQPQVGENTMFTDSRTMENWSRGYIASVAQQGLISGYPDGRFGPKDNLTRGQAAIILVNALGTPLMEAGDYTLGSVWGNVTITQSGTTLRNTVIGGDLYITEGVDLGHVTLENVTVLGKIVVCGGGVSEGGEDSIILRNVTAPELLVDNLDNHLLSLKVEGDGKIDQAYVRTSAYLADNTVDGCGIAKITMDGEEDEALTLAGNVKEVINKAPNTSVSLASGQADTITVDENAVGSTLDIAAGSRVDNVNLDTGVDVTGGGDIGKLTVNSDGSTVAMLPDQITIRPGITANINGEVMDSAAAAESSADPRLYAGYPKMKDLAPTSGTAVFSANKKGTVYWALTAVTDGSVTADELVNPSAYNPKVVKSGTVSLTGSGKEGTSSISGLTSDGSYYLSAVFVDARENRSPLKVISFTTPDNTKPDFASGYPYLSKITKNSAQVTTMATKSCRLYWAVLPKGASAPTANDFKANAVSGNLGFGSTDVVKNMAYSFDVNNVPLKELESYDLYLWLTDVDNGQSSAVKKLSFTTVDGTPPVFNTEPTINKVDKTSVGLYANLNEAGTLYWVVVAQGEEYPKPMVGQSGAVDWTSDTAKIQVANGMNGIKSGKVSMTEGKDVSFTVSGLETEKAYDLYYVAQDKAGNYTVSIGKITIHTLDSNAPTVTQEFTSYNGTDATHPLPNSDVRLVFSEAVQYAGTNTPLYELYQDVLQGKEDKEKLAGILRDSIKLYQHTGNGPDTLVTDYDNDKDNWTINYNEVEVSLEDGKTVVIFPGERALNLQSGATYYFVIQDNSIADISESKNVMGKTPLAQFTTVFAQVNISAVNISEISVGTGEDSKVTANGVWKLNPITTSKVGDDVDWDMLIWSDTTITFNIYRRTGESGVWTKVNTGDPLRINQTSTSDGYQGVSLTKDVINDNPTTPNFEPLNTLKENTAYEYAIQFISVNGETAPEAWNGRVNIKISVVAGSARDLWMLANSVTNAGWQENVVNGDVTDIGLPTDFILKIPFTDQSTPQFADGYPLITAEASTAELQLALNRNGTIYYVVAPMGSVPTEGTKPSAPNKSVNYGDLENWQTLPDGNGIIEGTEELPKVTKPEVDRITAPESWASQNKDAQYGNVYFSTIVAKVQLENLIPDQEYIAYFVLQNTAQKYSEVLCYRFKTSTVDTPYITLTPGDGSVGIKTSEKSITSYLVVSSQDANRMNPLNQLFTATDINGKALYMSDSDLATFQKSYGTNMTILQALSTTVSATGASAYEGPSLFDKYANDTIKEQIGQMVRDPQSVYTVASRTDFPTAKGQLLTEVFRDKMKEGVSYTCIAVAYNADGGQIDGFKAQGNISIRDNDPPTLTVTNSGQVGKDGKWSGVVTLTFSENLYWQSNTSSDMTTLKAVVGGGGDGKTTISLLNCIDAPKGTTVENAGTTPTAVFRLRYTDITVGETITLFANGGLISDQVPNTRDQVQLIFAGELGLITQPDEVPGFVINKGKIDGDIDNNTP